MNSIELLVGIDEKGREGVEERVGCREVIDVLFPDDDASGRLAASLNGPSSRRESSPNARHTKSSIPSTTACLVIAAFCADDTAPLPSSTSTYSTPRSRGVNHRKSTLLRFEPLSALRQMHEGDYKTQ